MDDAPAPSVTLEHVRLAAERLRGVAHRTPVVTSRTLDQRCGARVFLKCENLQRSGAFKFRGAFNAVGALPPAARRNGLLTYSSGNHAGALALVGSLLGAPVTVIMPRGATRAKLAAARDYGAEVIVYDPAGAEREKLGARLRDDRGLTLIPPYDAAEIVAGQGTAALELFEDVGPLDALLVPCGGGGLLSGCAVVARSLAPGCRVVGVEPALADDAARSFRLGELQRVENPATVADGLRTPSLGEITFPLVRRFVDEFRTVTETEIITAMAFLWQRVKLVVEPSGAVGAAPLLGPAIAELRGARVGVLVTGGNVDIAQVCRLLTES